MRWVSLFPLLSGLFLLQRLLDGVVEVLLKFLRTEDGISSALARVFAGFAATVVGVDDDECKRKGRKDEDADGSTVRCRSSWKLWIGVHCVSVLIARSETPNSV